MPEHGCCPSIAQTPFFIPTQGNKLTRDAFQRLTPGLYRDSIPHNDSKIDLN
jgi:hypothetical protein